MRLLDEIRVTGFRSLRNIVIKNLGDLSSFAGANNSGKSNILRALNAFFTDCTDPGVKLDVNADYYRPDLLKHKAKEISVTVRFTLPTSFRFRKDLEPVQQLLGSQTFSITKVWRRGLVQPRMSLNGSTLDADERVKVNQFLQLIAFRYVANRVMPLDMIRSEQLALRNALIRRVSQRIPPEDKTFSVIGETAASMIKNLSERFVHVYSNAQGLRLSVPSSWNDLIFAFGYVLKESGVELEDTLQGSGIQSLLMYETLYLIDQDYFQQFGWKQASIWAVEEPESSLHTSLEAQLAEFFASVAGAGRGRLQILATTHSDLMIQYSDCANLVETETNGTVVRPGSPQEVVDNSARAGVSRWVDPLLHLPLDPVLLVEGKIDRIVIEAVRRVIGSPRRIRIMDLEALEGGSSGGVEKIRRYVKDRVPMIRTRQAFARVHLLLDWDSVAKVQSFSELFKVEDPFSCSAWNPDEANPKIGPSVHGIERFYSDRLISLAEAGGAHVARWADGTVVVSKDDLGPFKSLLAKEIECNGLQMEDVQFLRGTLEALFGMLCESTV
jgi:hypothetical protein